ncbi:MAG: hypothetical protein HZC38_03925 [Chloroflexi bacterium]|nr:hypothetical protein [Chloroflexota bacterium]
MILKTSKRIQALPPYFFDGLNKRIAQLRSEGKDVIRMDMGSPDQQTHRAVEVRRQGRHPHGYGIARPAARAVHR